MFTRIAKIILLCGLVLVFALPNVPGFAQEENLEELCQWEKLEEKPEDLSKEDYSALLGKCQLYYEEKSEEIANDLTKTQAEKKTLQNKVYTLRKQIENLDYQIYQSNVLVKDIGLQIQDTEGSIDKTALKIEDLRENLLQVLQIMYEKDQESPIEILLSGEKISDFFEDIAALEALNLQNRELLENIKTLKVSLQGQKLALGDEKTDLEKMLKIQRLQKEQSQATKGEQEWLLQRTKGQESEYQKLLQESREAAQKIMERIFSLIGVPDAPTFGEALRLAEYVESITGVRPALVLAVLTQESNIGKNVGQCYLTDAKTGKGVRTKTGKEQAGVMAPGPPYHKKRNDVAFFLEITRKSGRDPYETLISCPINNPSLGLIAGKNSWGGAMGPAQFIPATWADPYGSPTKVSYEDRVKEVTGRPAADPWDIKDAFLASGLYLSDYGAKSQTRNGEWRAAMIYFAGTTNSRYKWYGDSVLWIADCYQDFLDTDSMSLGCQKTTGLGNND